MNNLEPKWLPISKLPDTTPENILSWLTAEVSLTARLRTLGTFTVQLQQESWGAGAATECELLGIPQDTQLWQRDVALLINEKPTVIAHTLIPKETLTALPQLKNLGNRSLGDLIFKDLHGTRDCLEFAEITAQHRLFAGTRAFHQADTLWARRSLLSACGHSLLVNEVFIFNKKEDI
jgi:chorismate--pyruvate lyase